MEPGKPITLSFSEKAARMRERDLLQQEVDRSFSSRFLEALGQRSAGLGQGIARGAVTSASLPAVALSPLIKLATGRKNELSGGPLTRDYWEAPTYDFTRTAAGRAVFGDKPFSLTSEGQELSEFVGMSPETAAKYALPVGVLSASTDWITGGGKSAAIKNAGKVLSKTDDVAVTYNTLRQLFKLPDTTLDNIAKSIVPLTDEAQVTKRLLDVGKGEASMNTIGKMVYQSKLSKDDFVKQFEAGLNAPNGTDIKRNADDLSTALGRTGLTMDEFWEGFVKTAKAPKLDAKGAKILGKEPPKMITRAETTLLKDRIRTLAREASAEARAFARGEKAGTVATKKAIKNWQKEYDTFVQKNLPPALRSSAYKYIKSINSPKTFVRAMGKLTEKVDQYEELIASMKARSSWMSKIAFIRKLGDFNNTLYKDIKNELGINGSLKDFEISELERFYNAAVERLQFAKAAGKRTNVVRDGKIVEPEPYTPPPTVSDEYIAKLSEKKKSNRLERAANNIKETIGNVGDLVGVLSTELKKVNPKLFASLRTYDIKLGQRLAADKAVVDQFYKRLKKAKMSRLDADIWKAAAYNGNTETVKMLMKKYDLEDIFDDTTKMKNAVYDRALKMNFDMGFVKNHFPRYVKTDPTSTKKMMEFFEQSDRASDFEKAWREKSAVLGRELNDAEKVQIASNMFRGFKGKVVSLSPTGNMLARQIREIPAELLQYYEDPIASLYRYVEEMNTRIETKRLLSKELPGVGLVDDGNIDIQNVFSAWFVKLENEGVKLTSKQQERVRDLMKARFASGSMNKGFRALKNAGYLTLMGSSPTSVVSQLPDLAWSIYYSGVRGFGSIGRAFTGRSRVKIRDYNITRLTSEMESAGTLEKWVDQTFKWIGLTKFDSLLKESTSDSVITAIMRKAEKGDKEFMQTLKDFADVGAFDGRTAKEVADKLARGVVDEDAKFMAMSGLADTQPTFLSEMPVTYLRAGNGKIVYQMMSFFTKQMDVVRREAIQRMKRGIKTRNPKEFGAGMYNMMKIATLLVALNATADEIKDWMFGKKDRPPLSERLQENALKTFFAINRYQWDNLSSQGPEGLIANQLTPPFTSVITSAYKDVGESLDAEKQASVANLRSVRYVPGVGGPFYWWFGRGADSQAKKSSSKPKSRIVDTGRGNSFRTSSGRDITIY